MNGDPESFDNALPITPFPNGDQPPPCSEEEEETILGCCLLDEGFTIDRCLSSGLTPESFFFPNPRLCFSILREMRAAKQAISLEVLSNELKERRQLQAIGGFPWLMQVTGRAPTTAHASYFIAKVREKHLLRETIDASKRAIEEAQSYKGTTPTELADFLASTQQRLEFISAGPARNSWPDPSTASSLCAKPPPTPEVLVSGLLYRGGTMLISGPSKAHKTYTMLDAAIAVAHGRKWLSFPTTKTAVLYVNLELQGFAVAHRVTQICSALGIEAPPNLHIWNLRGQNVTLTSLSMVLPKKIKELGAGLVIIDPHYKISSVSGNEENSNDSQGQLLSALEALCGLNGAALAVCHHFAKGDASAKNAIDRASGAGVFARWGDVMLTFTPHEEDEAMTVEMALRNFAPVEPFVVRWSHPRWSLDEALDPSKLKQRGGSKERFSSDDLLGLLTNGPMNFTEWHDKSGLSESTFQRKRNELVKSGKVVLQMGLYQAI